MNYKSSSFKQGLALAVIVATSAQAATTGTIVLSGTVPVVSSISIEPAAGSGALDLTTTSTNLTVANVKESSNSQTGYKVTLSSANSGQLKNGAIGSVAYTAQYNGQNVVLSTTGVTVTNVTTSNTPTVNASKALTISYTGQPATSMIAGTYSDTLTFTIAAN